jgi:hypothetical protein
MWEGLSGFGDSCIVSSKYLANWEQQGLETMERIFSIGIFFGNGTRYEIGPWFCYLIF